MVSKSFTYKNVWPKVMMEQNKGHIEHILDETKNV